MNKWKPIPEMTDEEFIIHFGVPGMKWGVRRNLRKARAKAASYKKAVDSDKSPARFIAAKPIRDAVGKGAASTKASASKFKKEIGPAVKEQWKKDMANAHARDVKVLKTMGFKKLAKKVEAQGPTEWKDTPLGKAQTGGKKVKAGTTKLAKAYNKKAEQILSDPKSKAKFEMGVAAVGATVGAVGSVALWKYAN